MTTYLKVTKQYALADCEQLICYKFLNVSLLLCHKKDRAFNNGRKISENKGPQTVLVSELQILQNKAAKVMLGQPPRSSSTEALNSLDLKSLSTRRLFHRCITIHKCLIGETDFNFNLTKNQAIHSYNTRRSNDIRLPLPRTNWGKQTFIFHATKDWNSLPTDLKVSFFIYILIQVKNVFKRSQLIFKP